MSDRPDWCVGFHPQGPHVPDDQALVATNIGPNVNLCRPCWSRWIRTDATGRPTSSNVDTDEGRGTLEPWPDPPPGVAAATRMAAQNVDQGGGADAPLPHKTTRKAER